MDHWCQKNADSPEFDRVSSWLPQIWGGQCDQDLARGGFFTWVCACFLSSQEGYGCVISHRPQQLIQKENISKGLEESRFGLDIDFRCNWLGLQLNEALDVSSWKLSFGSRRWNFSFEILSEGQDCCIATAEWKELSEKIVQAIHEECKEKNRKLIISIQLGELEDCQVKYFNADSCWIPVGLLYLTCFFLLSTVHATTWF